MTAQHTTMASGRWHTLSLMEQLGHVGSEVDRAAHWAKKGDRAHTLSAVDRALELIDLTVADPALRSSARKEVLCAREVVCDLFYGDNQYHSTYESLQKYFLQFALASRKNR